MQRFLFATPLMLLWVILSQEYTLISFVIGLVLGLAIAFAITPPGVLSSPAKLLRQAYWAVIYVVYLTYEVILSSIDVTRRVIMPKMPIDPAIIEIKTLDDTHNNRITALTSHAITMTPGELVVRAHADGTLEVHVLDVGSATTQDDQVNRLKLLRKVLGYD